MGDDPALAGVPAVLDALEARARTAALDDEGQRKWRLPDLELGVKPSFTTKQWRERERTLHKKALRTMRSSVAQTVEQHMSMLKRQEEILSLGSSNKAHALELQLARIRRENEALAKRLVKVQETETEITATNLPARRTHVKTMKDRKKYLNTARRHAQNKLDMENAQFLQRLITAKPSIRPRNQLNEEYRHHRKVCKNMCRLSVPPHSRKQLRPSTQGRNLPSLSGNANSFSSPSLLGMTKSNEDSKSSQTQHSRCIQADTQDLFRRPLSRSMEALSLNPSAANDVNHATGGKVTTRPMSKEEHRAQHAQDKADRAIIRSNEDRGQLCHQRVHIPHVRPAEQPILVDALLIGFKHPKEPNQLLFEVTVGPITRYAKVSYEIMRQALEEASVNSILAVQGINLAEVAASHLRLFGNENTLMLIWQ